MWRDLRTFTKQFMDWVYADEWLKLCISQSWQFEYGKLRLKVGLCWVAKIMFNCKKWPHVLIAGYKSNSFVLDVYIHSY